MSGYRNILAVCPSCREAAQQYEALVASCNPAMAAADQLDVDPGPFWSQTEAEKIPCFSRLAERTNSSDRGQNAMWGAETAAPAAYGRDFCILL